MTPPDDSPKPAEDQKPEPGHPCSMCGRHPAVYAIPPGSVVIPRDIYLRLLAEAYRPASSDIPAEGDGPTIEETRWTGGTFESYVQPPVSNNFDEKVEVVG